MQKRKLKPINKQLIQADIQHLNHDGRGIARIEGKTTFIFGALPKETVQFHYENRHSKLDEGIAVEIITQAPERVIAQCKHFTVCGGCSLQHMASQQQINYKQEILLNHWQHYANTKPEVLLAPLTGPHWHYRHKARLGVRYVRKKEKVLVGFRERNGRFLADLEHCEILHPAIGNLIEPLKTLITQLEKYNAIAQIEAAVGDDHAALIFRNLETLPESDLIKLNSFAKEYKLQVYLQPKGPDSVYLLAPENTPSRLYYRIPDYQLTMAFHPLDFTQVNPAINRTMINRALELLDLKPHETVLDLFCGLGNFTLPIAKHCHKAVGVEGSSVMVERGYENAKANNLSNLEFYAADLSQDFSQQPWAQQKYDKLLLDPPRSGALEIVQQIPALGIQHIVYISCNPATLARDTGELIQQGFQLTHGGVMDMFPHTSHVESIAVFQKR